jgi:DNA polymerase III delta prime subunit
MSMFIPPGQLWLGSSVTLPDYVKHYLQEQWCSFKSCDTCSVCTRIRDHQHHALLWMRPEKSTYTIEQIEAVRKQLSLAREEPFFIVLESADLLSRACANSLLKSLEEPPAHYHFILLASRLELILPTIVSRCVIRSFSGQDTPDAPFLEHFKQVKLQSLASVARDIDSNTISEYDSRVYLDHLLEYWSREYKNSCLSDSVAVQEHSQRMLTILTGAQQRLPMPGSAKFFWRALYVQISCLKK